MTRDFTYEMYSKLLETGLDSDYTFLTVKKYLSQETTPKQSIILRHDIDRKPENALDLARIESDAGVSSTIE